MLNPMYKPFNVDNTPKTVIESWHSKIQEVIEDIKPNSHEFILLENIIILKHDLDKPITDVRIFTKKDYENESQEDKDIMNKLKIELELTQKEIDHLNKELIKAKFKKLNISQKIEHLKKKVYGQRNKIKAEFETNYEKFFLTLNTKLQDLEKKDKQDINVLLENMSAVIKDTISKLK